MRANITYPCSLCEYQATQKQPLKKHKMVIHGIGKLKCKYCNEQFTHAARENMDKHLEEVHNEKVIKRARNKPMYRSKYSKRNQHIKSMQFGKQNFDIQFVNHL